MKRTISIAILLLIILMLTFSFMKMRTNIYIGDYSYHNIYPKIDFQLEIDNKLILNDSLSCNPFNSIKIKENLRFGFHRVNISSESANINQEKKIFLLPNQYILIEFFPFGFFGSSLEKNMACFDIRNTFNPFYPD